MRSERGLAPAIEATIIIPGLILLVGLVVVVARVVLLQQDLHSVVASAARTAAIERSPAAAERAVTELIRVSVDRERFTCATPAVDASGLSAPLGVEAEVTVELRCSVSFADVSLPVLPGDLTVTARAGSPVDRYRAR